MTRILLLLTRLLAAAALLLARLARSRGTLLLLVRFLIGILVGILVRHTLLLEG